VSERVAFYVFGIALSGALTIAIGRPLLVRPSRRLVAALVVFAVFLGLLFGWAIDGYIAYVRMSAQRF
jgi:hypothetical protein